MNIMQESLFLFKGTKIINLQGQGAIGGGKQPAGGVASKVIAGQIPVQEPSAIFSFML